MGVLDVLPKLVREANVAGTFAAGPGSTQAGTPVTWRCLWCDERGTYVTGVARKVTCPECATTAIVTFYRPV